MLAACIDRVDAEIFYVRCIAKSILADGRFDSSVDLNGAALLAAPVLGLGRQAIGVIEATNSAQTFAHSDQQALTMLCLLLSPYLQLLDVSRSVIRAGGVENSNEFDGAE